MIYKTISQKKNSGARTGKLNTPYGEIQTPCFMPVGTQACVKTLANKELLECGAQLILCNTYHLYTRPGIELIKKAGGLHEFMNWQKPILTDSGGYQVFSLGNASYKKKKYSTACPMRNINDKGVKFKAPLDGREYFFTPEEIVKAQVDLDSDIIMVLDECVEYPCEYDYAKEAMERTVRWAKRSKTEFNRLQATSYRLQAEDKNNQFLKPEAYSQKLVFGITQGSTYFDLREECIDELVKLNFDGYAVGGVSVGEPREELIKIIEYAGHELPAEKPRYLMGVGTPLDIIESVGYGFDMFDCSIPTRHGRNGTVYTWCGKKVIKNSQYEKDLRPIDEDCSCYTCRTYSRAYLKHLFAIREMLAMRLLSLHNVYFYIELMRKIRKAINEKTFAEFKNKFIERYKNADSRKSNAD